MEGVGAQRDLSDRWRKDLKLLAADLCAAFLQIMDC
jgi:hypothetical protein